MEPQKSLREDGLLWLLLGAALVLVLGYWFLLMNTKEGDDAPNWLFSDVPAHSVMTLRRYEENQLKFEVTRSADGSGWTIRSPEKIDVNDDAVNRWVNSLLNPDISRRFQGHADSDYGFNRSDTRIQVVVNKTPHDLYLGGKPPTGNGLYLRYGSGRQAPVFLVPNSARSTFDRTLYDLRDKRLLDGNLGSVTGLELRTDQGRVRYRKEEKGWILSEPEKKTLNDTRIQSIEEALTSLRTVRVDRFFDDDVPEELKPERARVILRTGEEERLITIEGTREDQRIVRVNDRPVVALSSDPVGMLKDLPRKPPGWPETKSSDNVSEKEDFPERIQEMKPGGSSIPDR